MKTGYEGEIIGEAEFRRSATEKGFNADEVVSLLRDLGRAGFASVIFTPEEIGENVNRVQFEKALAVCGHAMLNHKIQEA